MYLVGVGTNGGYIVKQAGQGGTKRGIFARMLALENSGTALAPAAGAGIGKLLAEKLLADPNFVQLMVDAAKGGLEATRSFWCGKGASGYLETEPDTRTRIQTLALLLAHMEGEPIKRIIHQHLGGNGTVDPLAALQESPALRDAAKKLLEKAEWRHSGHKASKRPVKAAAALEVDLG